MTNISYLNSDLNQLRRSTNAKPKCLQLPTIFYQYLGRKAIVVLTPARVFDQTKQVVHIMILTLMITSMTWRMNTFPWENPFMGPPYHRHQLR